MPTDLAARLYTTPDFSRTPDVMNDFARLFCVAALLLAVSFLPAHAQVDGNHAVADISQMTSVDEDAPESVVVDDQYQYAPSVGVNTEGLERFANSPNGLRPISMGTRTVHSGALPSRSFPAPQMSTQRKVLYIVGGAVVVGGAILGIVALGDDGGGGGGGPGPIPGPPSRP